MIAEQLRNAIADGGLHVITVQSEYRRELAERALSRLGSPEDAARITIKVA
jgi:hypothetical protein